MGKTFGERLKDIFLPANPVANAVLWGIVAMVGILGIFSSYYLPHNFFLVEGEVSDVTIEADKTVEYVDAAKTAENKQAASDRVADIYGYQESVLIGQIEQLNQLFIAWEELAAIPDPVEGAALSVDEIDEEGSGQEELGESGLADGADTVEPAPIAMKTKFEQAAPYIAQLQIKESVAQAILDLDSVTLQSLRSEGVSIMTQLWSKGVRTEEEVEDARKKMLDEVYVRISNEDQVSFLQATFRFISLRANYIFDEENTLRAKTEAADKEPPVMDTVYRTQKVIGKGELVTANHIAALRALGYQRVEAPYVMLAGVGLFSGCIVFLLSRYMKEFPPKSFSDGKHNALMALLFLLILGISRIIVAVNINPEPVIAEQVAYLIPASTGAILAAILLDHWVGAFFGTIISIYIGLLSGGGLSYAVTAFAGCIMGVYGISRYTRRTQWAKAGFMIALVNMWMIVGLGIINNHDRMTILYAVIMGVVNGFLSPILAYGSLPFLEAGFKITTSVSLMELSDPRQPLLKELLLKAPGTYHHSILVGNLAEAAADEIGADPVLVRVGAYYHDIGKSKRPYFFVENQLSDANPHEKLSPALSAMILSAHVKDGIEIGRKYKLPEKILDFITQHHGDGIMAFFYHKAVDEAGGPENVKESDFRYPGPKPQSKETALVSLADSVEAAVRSMHVTGEALEAAVKKVVNGKVADGQMEDSPLSLSDLKVVAQVFTKVLNGIYHNRIEYPENVQALMGRDDGKTDEIADAQAVAEGQAQAEMLAVSDEQSQAKTQMQEDPHEAAGRETSPGVWEIVEDEPDHMRESVKQEDSIPVSVAVKDIPQTGTGAVR